MSNKGNVVEAAKEYISRQNRDAHPDGTWDKAGRWTPSSTEEQKCCKGIRGPTRSYPYSLMLHCRCVKHIANLYSIDVKEMRLLLRAGNRSLLRL